MIVQLVYWKSLCSKRLRNYHGKKDFYEQSVEEIEALKRTMQRHSGEKFSKFG